MLFGCGGGSNEGFTRIDEKEPNETDDQATTITIPSVVVGIAKAGDASISLTSQDEERTLEDAFTFSLSNESTVNLVLSTDNKADFDLYLFNAADLIAFENALGTGAEVINELLPAGQYFINIDAFDNITDVAYTMKVTFQ